MDRYFKNRYIFSHRYELYVNGLAFCTSLDLSTFNTSNVQNLEYMLAFSTSIININLTLFDI